MTANGPAHYRLTDSLYESGLHLHVNIFSVYRATPEGYWLATHGYVPDWMTFQQLRKGKYLRWVSKNSDRRFAYPTMEEALHSYKRRKQAQLRHARHAVEMATTALDGLPKHDEISQDQHPRGFNLGKLPSHDSWSFD